MSGHSKWHRIKHKKAQTDSKRSQLFGRLSREIRVATQKGGKDPNRNAALREAIDRAKKFNLPQVNIERLLNKDSNAITSVLYEGYGPGGVAILVATTTDNTNRTVSELRTLFKKHGGNLGDPGSVLWKFSSALSTTATLPTSLPLEKIELELIDAGADDLSLDDGELMVTSSTEAEASIRAILEANHATEIYAEPTYVVSSSQVVPISESDQANLDALLAELSEHGDVEAIHHDALLY